MTRTANGTGAESVNAQIGRRVNARMIDAGMTQGQLAAAIGLTQAAVSRKLAGERPWFAPELVNVAQVLGTSVGELFGEPEPPGQPLFSFPQLAGAAA